MPELTNETLATAKATILDACLALRQSVQKLEILADSIPIETSPPPPLVRVVLLEDFISPRRNGEEEPLWDVYLGEDPGQTAVIANGMFTAKVPLSTGQGVYVHFLPRGKEGYAGVGGKLRDYIKLGKWDPEFNRLSFLMRVNKDIASRKDGGDNFQIGTYIAPQHNTMVNNQGVHYYHLANLELKAGAWYKIVLTRWPQHQVGKDPAVNWPEDPEFVKGNGSHYFDGMTRLYFDSQSDDWDGAVVDFASVKLFEELNAPDTEIGTLAYGYSGKEYFVSWAGRKGVDRAYEVRYSTDPIVDFKASSYSGVVLNTGNAYCGNIWKRAAPEAPNGLYVAIAVQGKPLFAQVYIPNNMGPNNDGL